MPDIIDQRIEILKLAASLNAPNSHVPDVMRTADKLWDWATLGQPPVSKTKANIIKSVERLGASQNSEKDNS